MDDGIFIGRVQNKRHMTCSRPINPLFFCTLSLECTLKLKVDYPSQLSFNFHTEIAHDTIQSSNYVVDKLILNSFLQLLIKLTYIFISMDFSCFVKNANFHL